MTYLSELNKNEEATVEEFEGEDALGIRLAELGLYSGNLIKMIKPGNNAIIGIGNGRFAIRKDILEKLKVEKFN